MSAYRKKRSDSLTTTDSDNRAKKLNQAADRFLCRQLSNYEREEKQLQRELLDLRKTRETLDAGFKLILSPRSRSSSEPLRGISDHPRRSSGFSSQLSAKLPPIVTRSPIPLRKAAKTPENLLQWSKATSNGVACPPDGQNHDIAVKEETDKTCFLSVPEKVRLHRTYSYSNENISRILDEEVKTNQKDKSCSTEVLNQTCPVQREANQESSPQAEEDDQGTSLKDDDAPGGFNGEIRKMRGRSHSDFSKDSLMYHLLPKSFSHGDPRSLLSPALYVPTAPLSPKPKRGNLCSSQSSKTNVDLMQSTKLSGKFKAVGHVALGAAVINRLNVKTPVIGESDLDDELAVGAGCRNLRRRGTVAHINLTSPYHSPASARKQKSCWTATKEDVSQGY